MASSLIPYFPPPTIDLPVLGPTPPFGLLVVIGIVVGWKLSLREFVKRGVGTDWTRDLLWWTVVTGMVVAKLFDSIFYSHEFNLRTGLSSTGGFIGAAMGYFAYFYKHPQYKHLRLLLSDAIVLGLSVGWIFGRMGCFVVHDHKGIFSDFILAIPFPEGQRHDLGFYEMSFTVVMAAVLFSLNAVKKWPPGFFIGLTGLMYGPVRFFLDFLRPQDTDQRYAMLTPAQWGSVAFTLFAAWTLWRALSGRTAVTHTGPIDPETGEPLETKAAPAEAGKAQGGSRKKKRKR